MLLRLTASFLLVFCAFAPTQASAQSAAPALKSFHDQTLGVTYFYPGHFNAVVPLAPPKASLTKADTTPQCVRTSFSAGSSPAMGDSAFVFSTIDGACPGILQQAQQLGSFTKDQILRQLKRYGTPTITRQPSRYTIEGHPAAVTVASAAGDTKLPNGSLLTTYAVKACMLNDRAGAATTKKDDARDVLCFDFTTQRRELLTSVLTFVIQADGHPPQSIVPSSTVR
jgi:hypothetical protein